MKAQPMTDKQAKLINELFIKVLETKKDNIYIKKTSNDIVKNNNDIVKGV